MATALTVESMESVIEASSKRMEEDAWIIKGLRKQNERLKEEKLNAELEASLLIASLKFREAQLFGRVMDAEKAIAKLQTLVQALADSCDRMANHQQGLVNRDEWKEHVAAFGQVKSDVSYLMGSTRV